MDEQPSGTPVNSGAPAGLGCAGCLMIPAGLGGLVLALGVWRLMHWSSNAPAANVLAVLLTGAGGFVVLVVGALVLIGIRVARLARQAKQDVQGIAQSMQYMMNMGRTGGERPGDVVVDAQEIKVEEVKAEEVKQIEEKKDDAS